MQQHDASLRDLLSTLPDGVILTDDEGEILYGNPAAAEIFGQESRTLVGRFCTDADWRVRTLDGERLPPGDRPVPSVLESGDPVESLVFVVPRQDGEERVVSASASPMRRGDEGVVGVVASLRDVTARHHARERAEEARDRSEEKYAKLFRATPLGTALSTLETGRFLDVNPGFEGLLGFERNELIGRLSSELGLWVEEARRERLQRHLREEGEAREMDARLRRKDGEVIEAEIFAQPIEIQGEDCILTITRDVTEQRAFQRRLERSREKLQRYASFVTSARERERTQLARDIHDHLGQLLTAVKLKVVRLQRATGRGEDPSRDAYGDITALIDEAVADVRNLSTSLRPSALDQFGLPDAIRWQTEQFEERFDIGATVECREEDIPLPEDAGIHVFRVVQEALTNVGRHADATAVTVRLERDGDTLTVQVLDDGVGLPDAPSDEAASHGLLGMEERAHVLGGEFTLRDRPEGGTEARLRVPLKGEGR